MEKAIQIVLHILPKEIDELERLCDQLHRGSFYLLPEDKVILDVTLNLSDKITDWKNSKIPKEFFIEKFNGIKLRADWTHKNLFEINDTDYCLGCNDKRRNSIRNHADQVSHILYLDPDVSAPIFALPYLFRSIENIKNEYYLVTAQIVKMWDNSWDPIVNSRYIDRRCDEHMYKEFDPYIIDKEFLDNSNVNVKQLDTFKFGGGWTYNLFSSNLLKFIDIPDELGPYGLDDTFVFQCAMMMAQKGYDVRQYVMENMLVCENRRYKDVIKSNPYTKLLTNKMTDEEKQRFTKNYHEHYQSCINRFVSKL